MGRLLSVIVSFVVVAPVVIAAERRELSTDPAMLLRPDFDARAVTINGVGLGDRVSQIAESAFSSKPQNGLAWLKSGLAIEYVDDQITSIMVKPEAFAAWKLNITTMDQIVLRFGEADRRAVTKLGETEWWNFAYPKRGLIVMAARPVDGKSQVRIRLVGKIRE